jgi:DNA-binding transcriptional LysR family regulator
MELRHLRYFIAVAEELHFGRAAERLCIAQPPLSQQIRQLEREIGFALFYRTQRRVELTSAAALFLDEARGALASLDKAAAAGRRIARGEVGWLGIGYVGSATYQALPAILAAFRACHPDVELVLRELVSARQADALRDRRIHVGLARPALAGDGIVSEPLVREPLYAAVPAGHSLAASNGVRLADLAAEPFILFPRHPKPSYADWIYDLCETAGFSPTVVQESADMHTAIGLVAAGMGVTLVPASVRAAHREGVAYLPLTGELASVSELCLAYRVGDTTPVLEAFLAVARSVPGPGWSGSGYLLVSG